MPPFRNQVEARSTGIATQYVSDTHDHKPDAPTKDGPPVFHGISLEIAAVIECHRVLGVALRDLIEASDAERMIPSMHAADDIAKTSNQMNNLSSHLSSVLRKHIDRDVRVRT